MINGIGHLAGTRVETTIAASFLASLVECVEALTVVLAVGSIRGWRSALAGTAAALALLAAIVSALGPALARIPLRAVQLVVGAMILLFGMRWLRKAVLRSAGVIPMHDEDEAFAKNAAAMRGGGRTRGRWDHLALAAAFNITMLEGTEVIFIVIALGAGGSGLLRPAAGGAVIALLTVIAAGIALHRPLARVPENAFKFMVGVLLTAFGTFWIAEGARLEWPGPASTNPDLAIPLLVLAYLLLALWLVPACRSRAAELGSEG
jgi:Ca2+/H+ antiporter, TMEM165/GDT1 family